MGSDGQSSCERCWKMPTTACCSRAALHALTGQEEREALMVKQWQPRSCLRQPEISSHGTQRWHALHACRKTQVDLPQRCLPTALLYISISTDAPQKRKGFFWNGATISRPRSQDLGDWKGLTSRAHVMQFVGMNQTC